MPEIPSKEEGFVSRWSRRKQQVAKEEGEQKVNSTSVVEEEIVDPEQLKAEKLEVLNKLTDEDMPDIETLNEDSDFSAFMSTSVSEGLRRLALKKLFMGASYNIRDGLDEYDGDYTKFEKMPSNMITADMKHMVQVEAKKKLEKEQEEARQKMIASGEIDEMDEFDEFADDEQEEIIAEAPEEEYVDEHINVEGFDTTIANDEDSDINKNTNGNSTNKNEEVA